MLFLEQIENIDCACACSNMFGIKILFLKIILFQNIYKKLVILAM